MMQVERLELQKTRLRKQLDNVKSFQERITIEKFILDIDMKIANIQIRLVGAQEKVRSITASKINKYYEEKKIKTRVMSPDIFWKVSDKGLEKIFKVLNEDMKF